MDQPASQWLSVCDKTTTAQGIAQFAIVIGAMVVAASASAQLININFTAPTFEYSGSNETSPATPSGPAGTWNNFTEAAQWNAEGVSVVYSDGSSAGTLTFDTGRSDSWSSSQTAIAPSKDFQGVDAVYDVDNLYEYGMRTDNDSNFGVRIRGLAAGEYQIFFVPFFRDWEDGILADTNANIAVGVDGAEDFNTGNFSLVNGDIDNVVISQHVNVDTELAAWVAGDDQNPGATYNYIGATVAINGPNDWLTFVVENVDKNLDLTGNRGGVSAIQILTGDFPPADDGDFNRDGDIDGEDFLKWQRDYPTLTANDLADWQDNYGMGNPLAQVASAVPEPMTGGLAVVAVLIGKLAYRRRQWKLLLAT